MRDVNQLIKELGKEYEVIVNTPHHVQIPCLKGKHNIWFTKTGLITFQPAGQREGHCTTPKALKEELKHFDYAKTDQGKMEEVIAFIRNVPIKEGIFVDAGWKDGRGRIAIIRINSGNIDVYVRPVKCKSAFEAEDMGIKMAARSYPGDEPIFNDCKAAVEKNAPRAKWLSREQNKDADKLSNLRGTTNAEGRGKDKA